MTGQDWAELSWRTTLTNDGVRPKLNTPQIHRHTDPREYNIILLILGNIEPVLLTLQKNLLKIESFIEKLSITYDNF